MPRRREDDSDSEDEARRRKKLKKERKKERKKDPKLYQMVGYSNEDNPFGDHNLNQAFVWKKKAERDGGQARQTVREKESKKQHFYDEIQKVRHRRSEREAEQEEMERIRAEEARLREAEQYADWHQKEESFHLEQAKVRSKIRLVEGREKPIDILAKNIILLANDEATEKTKEDEDLTRLEVELREPHTIFEGLSLEELRELMEDIKTYLELEGDGPHQGFWKSLRVLCKKEIDDCANRKKDTGIHGAVMDDVVQTFRGKTAQELDDMRQDIQGKIDANDGTLDLEFLEGMLVHLTVFRAQAEVREYHKTMLRRQLERLEDRRAALRREQLENPEKFASQQQAAADAAAAADADSGGLAAPDASSAATAMEAAERKKGLGDLEEELGLADEVELSKGYWWQDKHRPRKPRYFNRVKTGYEWNKYNQTHYDHDNPPPKTVQGYKFNIFYPDLIDRTVTPRYVCEPADTKEFMILRFTAGPPYEDIAFKIVNREWEFGKKHGFKAVYERGIMHLYFNFKRHRYRK